MQTDKDAHACREVSASEHLELVAHEWIFLIGPEFQPPVMYVRLSGIQRCVGGRNSVKRQTIHLFFNQILNIKWRKIGLSTDDRFICKTKLPKVTLSKKVTPKLLLMVRTNTAYHWLHECV